MNRLPGFLGHYAHCGEDLCIGYNVADDMYLDLKWNFTAVMARD